MKFDYCLGNPPYQEQKGGTKNVDIWPEFVKETSKIANIRCLIHPGRWVNPTSTRQNMHNDIISDNLQSFNYFSNSADVFPGTCIGGGITITLFNKNFNENPTVLFNGQNKKIYNANDKFLKNKFEEEIYHKIFNDIDVNKTMLSYIKGGIGALESPSEEFRQHLVSSPDNLQEPIKIWSSKTYGKGGANYTWNYIERKYINNSLECIHSKKVMLDKKGHPICEGKGAVIANLPQICDKNTYGINVLWVVPNQERERDLLLIKSLFMTKTARYLMCISQNSVYVRGFENIPDYLELAKLLPEDQLFTDEWFYKTFDFSEGLINEIETRVSPKVDKEA